MRTSLRLILAGGITIGAGGLAHAQVTPHADAPAPTGEPTAAARSRLAPGRLTIGLGAIAAPDYEGSDSYTISPAAGFLARVRGHNISFRGTSLAVDLVPEYRDQSFKIIFSTFVNVRLDRSTVSKDPVVALFRKRKVAAELGGTIGFVRNGILTSPYDSLTVQLSGSHDVGNVHKSFVITPTAQYMMPLSKGSLIGASLSADFVGARYARYYFGVGPRSSAASGLPLYRPSGGFKSATVGLFGAVSPRGDLSKGLAIAALVNYERLAGDFAASPLVATRGNADQVIAAVGLGFTF